MENWQIGFFHDYIGHQVASRRLVRVILVQTHNIPKDYSLQLIIVTFDAQKRRKGLCRSSDGDADNKRRMNIG